MKNLRYVAVSIISVLVIFTIYTNMTVVKTKGKTSNVANSFWKEAKSKKYAYNSFLDTTYKSKFESEYWESLKKGTPEKMYYDFLVNLNSSEKKDNPVYLFCDGDEYEWKEESRGFEFARKDHPELELMKIDSRWGWGSYFEGEENKKYGFSSVYYYNKDEYFTKLEEVNSEIENLVQTVNRTSEKIEKYRIIHNWIVENVNYYSSSEDMSNIFFKNYDEKFLSQYNMNTTQNIYGAIVKKQAICDGISDAFKYICNLCNLECVTVDGYLGKFSDERYHAWNIVKIENDWYLVDCTWDLNNNGEKYFLCSDLYKGDRTPFKINYKIPGYDK